MKFARLRSLIQQFEELLLALLLLVLIVLSCVQIGLRQFFDSGLFWADPLLRYLVLWAGMLGALLAVARNKHISLDILSNFFPKKIAPYITITNHLFSAVVCGFLTYASYLFIQGEIEFGSSPILDIPSWAWNLIFPITFFAMSLRFASSALFHVMAHFSSNPPPEQESNDPS